MLLEVAFNRPVFIGASRTSDLGTDDLAGAGGEVSTFFPDLGLGVSLRVIREFGAKNNSEGFVTVLTLTKAF